MEQVLGVAVKQRIRIPSDKVGILIGEGGNTLRMIRSVSGANVFVDPKPPHGAKERIVIITGNNEEVVEAARKLVEKITKQKEKVRQPQDVRPFEMMIPGNLVGKIVGKGGEVIKSLQKETGAKINVIQDGHDYAMEKPLRIWGTPEVVMAARKRVEEIIGVDLLSTVFEQRISIPKDKVGLIIGPGGDTIKQLSLTTGASCLVDLHHPEGATEKNIVIRGNNEEAVEAARRGVEQVLDQRTELSSLDLDNKGKIIKKFSLTSSISCPMDNNNASDRVTENDIVINADSLSVQKPKVTVDYIYF